MNHDQIRSPRTKRVAGAALAGCAALLGACSSEPVPTVPAGSTLSIAPSEQMWEIADRRDEEGRCFIDPTNFVDLPILVSLRDSSGIPVGDVDVDVYVNLADNTYSGFPVVQLYDDLNGNGIIDGDSELVSDEGDAIARVRTSRRGGEHLLLARTNLSCPYRTGVFAFVGSISAQSSIVVSVEEEN